MPTRRQRKFRIGEGSDPAMWSLPDALPARSGPLPSTLHLQRVEVPSRAYFPMYNLLSACYNPHVDKNAPLAPQNPEIALRLLEAYITLPGTNRDFRRAYRHLEAWCTATGTEFPSDSICRLWFGNGLSIPGKPYLERPFPEIAAAFDRHELSMADLFYRDNYGAAMAETTAVRYLSLTDTLLGSPEYMEAIKKDPKIHALIGEKITDALSLMKPKGNGGPAKTREQIAAETLQATIELLSVAPDLVLSKLSDEALDKIRAALKVTA